ncbi:sulfotransferase family protein [Roseobacter denitrificans]|uniref:Sulfotransferase n=1 Tax=Roseobacter denitrificans (strain ATCC 33942 / OCh 114) TaxID=375451 RepID=Q16CL6_ROSDO|nr:sulfotransferase [Roseobacter denitrificans]ABG30277.1 hypothetical protein RD1_0572 [Roseobacter denitrificans OCh 114]AVL53455.1 sulfotransferase family protein [Roseobacter denitrificans]SFF71181.1 Sulfotransferase family protein [Roseobacter denitrificans OCh 114]
MTPFFITGFLRSGTTLLEKYLHNHPQMVVASQPFPFLFKALKETFFRSLGMDVPRYPLGHLCGDAGYGRQAFLDFASTHHFTDAEVKAIFEQMRGYSGQLTPGVFDLPLKGGTLQQVFVQCATQFPALFDAPAAEHVGVKEVFCEEFIPLFLQHRMPVLLILRDPRAVVASIHCGRGGEYANAGLSVLHILRCWRKSVAYAMRFSGEQGFHWMTYERLAQDPAACLQPIARAFGADPFPDAVLSGALLSQDASPWRGNSSFGAPDARNPRFRKLLDADTITFIDTLCQAEMQWLGMEHDAHSAKTVLESYQDLFQPGAPFLSQEDKQTEYHRLAALAAQVIDPAEAENWCIYPSVQRRLHAVLH